MTFEPKQPEPPKTDLRYDTASMRTYARNLGEFFDELRRGPFSRGEAFRLVIEFVRGVAISAAGMKKEGE